MHLAQKGDAGYEDSQELQNRKICQIEAIRRRIFTDKNNNCEPEYKWEIKNHLWDLCYGTY